MAIVSNPYSKTTTSGSNIIVTNWISNTSVYTNSTQQNITLFKNKHSAMWVDSNGYSGTIKVVAGQDYRIELPDGAILEINADGSYRVIDSTAKITYKANRVREFNRYINASDLLEEFIDFVDNIGGFDKQRFLNLPIETFIQWLVLRAAQADGETVEEDKIAIERKVRQSHCRVCGKFVSKKKSSNNIPFCSTEHYVKFENSL